MIHNYAASGPIPPITAYHKTESLKEILVQSRQAKPTSLHSAPNEHVSNNDWNLNDHYATLSKPTHTSQLAHCLWQRLLNTLHGLFHPSNLNPTYTSFSSRTSWSSTLCLTHSCFPLQKLGIPNHVVFATNSGRTKPCVHILASRQLYVPNYMATLNQSTAISFHKRTLWYIISLKHTTFK